MATIMIRSDVASATDGLIYEFSHDGINIGLSKAVSVPIAGDAHTVTHIAKHFRIKYINGSIPSTKLVIQVIHHRNKNKPLTSNVTQEITDASDVENVRSVIVGKNSGGTYRNVTIDPENSLNVSITNPTTSFGELAVAQPHMIIQSAFVYDEINPQKWLVDTANGGNVSVMNSLCQLTINESIGSTASIRSTKNIHYNPGQGLGCRFTTIFANPVPDSIQTAGVVAPGNGIGFGFNGTRFGVFRRTGGKQEINRLLITHRATVSQNVTVTLDGVSYEIQVQPGDIHYVAHQLAVADYPGADFTTEHQDDSVIYIKQCRDMQVREFDTMISDGDAQGTFQLVTAGIVPTVTWTYQEDFNVDRLDGTGPSKMTIDPHKGNVYQITYHWLGFGNYAYFVENPDNGRFIACHREKYSNKQTELSMTVPTMPIEFTIRSIASETSMTMNIGSVSGYVEGTPNLNGLKYVHTSRKQWCAAPFRVKNYTQNIMTLVNGSIFRGQTNMAVMIPEAISIRTRTTGDVILILVINPEYIGTDTATDHHIYKHVNSEHSIALYDINTKTSRGGTILEEIRMGGQSSMNVDLKRHHITLEASQSFLLKGYIESYGTGTVTATMLWTEIH